MDPAPMDFDCSFDAPKFFCNLKAMDLDCDGDAWFDRVNNCGNYQDNIVDENKLQVPVIADFITARIGEQSELSQDENTEPHTHVATAEPTVKSPKSRTPCLATAQRALVRKSVTIKPLEEDVSNFRSRPLNRRILESPSIGLRKHKPNAATTPLQPVFKTDQRFKIKTQSLTGSAIKIAKQSTPSELTNRESPRINNIPKVQKAPSSCTKQLQFGSASNILTVPKPFVFETDKIDARYKDKLRERLSKQEEERRKAAEFHARPMPNFGRIFRPHYVPSTVTEPDAVVLNTEHRAVERKLFDDKIKDKLERMELKRQEMELKEKQMAEEEIRQMRKDLVHHPLPYKITKPVEVKRGMPMVTLPLSPLLKTKARSHERLLPRSKN